MALVLGIAQLPALLVTLPAIIYIWASGDYGNAAAIVYTIVLGTLSLGSTLFGGRGYFAHGCAR